MPHLTANMLHNGRANWDYEIANQDYVLGTFTLSAVSTTLSFDLLNLGTGMAVFAYTDGHFPTSSSYVLAFQGRPPVGPAV